MTITPQQLKDMQRRISGSKRFVVGIDPGRSTGYSYFRQGEMVVCASDIPIRVERWLLNLKESIGADLFVVIEDTRSLRLPSHLQSSSARDKGVGGVWAEVSRWEDFMQYHSIQYKMNPLSKSIPRKTTAERFKKDFPNFKGRTNHNARDAAYLGRHFA